ncbi:hypothetical protein CRYUN_Cryun38cG0060400 [Craigia yunnanensis]
MVTRQLSPKLQSVGSKSSAIDQRSEVCFASSQRKKSENLTMERDRLQNAVEYAQKQNEEVGEHLGKKLEKNIYSIAQLQETCNLLRTGLRNINVFLSNDFVLSKSSLHAAKRIAEFLTCDSMNIFVLYEDSRMGKTTLVKDVIRQAKKFKADEEVVIIAVSQPLDIKDIQGQIVDSLDLKLKEKKSVKDRTRKLLSRLKQKKKILLILDDVLEEPNWKEIEIPYACDLLRKKAGLSEDTCPKIKEVANKIAKECLGLPMVIITLGSALRGKSNLDAWEDALKELQNSKEVDPVYRCLKLSFELLQSNDTRQCFLLCSLFPQYSGIDAEDLVRYAFGLKLFQDALTIEATRTRISAEI